MSAKEITKMTLGKAFRRNQLSRAVKVTGSKGRTVMINKLRAPSVLRMV